MGRSPGAHLAGAGALDVQRGPNCGRHSLRPWSPYGWFGFRPPHSPGRSGSAQGQPVILSVLLNFWGGGGRKSPSHMARQMVSLQGF